LIKTDAGEGREGGHAIGDVARSHSSIVGSEPAAYAGSPNTAPLLGTGKCATGGVGIDRFGGSLEVVDAS
jgi:hypothetical protein